MRSSLMIGYCFLISSAALRPSSTSCSGVYRFFGSFTAVCAKRLPAAFDVGVICSDFEGLPVAALEMLAAGIPMVSTAVGTMPTLLSGGAGFTVPVRDDAALADAIRRFMDDSELAARAGTRAREVIRGEYDFRRMVDAFERVYDRVLARDLHD